MPFNIRLAHEDHAFQAKARADCCRRHTVLAGAGLSNDPGFAHPHGKQDLAEAIIDFVRAGMIELITLQINLRATKMLGQAFSKIKRARAANIMGPEIIHLRRKSRVFLCRAIFLLQVQNERHKRFGDIASAKLAKTAILIGPLVPRISQIHYIAL